MITHFTPITETPPIYPVDYVSELVERVYDTLPHLDEEQANQAICAIFNVNSIGDLIDKESILEGYQFQPSLNRQQLAELTNRLYPFLGIGDGLTEEQIKKKALWAVRNIVNCVPCCVDDLIDYISDEGLSQINICFSPILKEESGFRENKEGLFHQQVKENATYDEIEAFGSLSMGLMNKEGFGSGDYGITKRQKFLIRAAEYYVLHLYGYQVATLWLAKFVNPSVSCSCPDPDCGNRHFGFMDIEASYRLVLDNIGYFDYLAGLIHAVPGSDDVTMDQVVEGNLVCLLSAIEALLIDDQERKRVYDLVQLLDKAFKHKEHLGDLDVVRLINLSNVVIRLYGDVFSVYEASEYLSEHVLEDAWVESLSMMDRIAKETDSMPAFEHLTLYDAHNFLVAGTELGDTEMGYEFQIRFLSSIYDAQQYRDLAKLIKEAVLPINDLKDRWRGMFTGFFENFSAGILVYRSMASHSHVDAVIDEARSDKALKRLSELGIPRAVMYRYNHAETDFELQYWEDRLFV